MIAERAVAGVLLALALAPAAARGADDTCLVGDCVDGFGTGHLSDDRIYCGMWSNGVAHGYGWEMTPDRSDVWRGAYLNGSLNGFAIFAARSGDHYAGGWRRGRRHGYGVYTYANGSRYQGAFVDGVREGIGEFRAPSGFHYTGSFVADRFDGDGSLVVPGLLHYQGSFGEGHREGEGREVFFDGMFEYRGHYRGDRPHGQGTLLEQGREIRTGDFDPEAGRGFGVVAREDGSVYVGELLDGKPDGRGAERSAAGSVEPGEWQAGSRLAAKGDAP